MKKRIAFQKDIAEAYVQNLKGFAKICPTCKTRKYGREQIISIEKEGECLDCSHLRGDTINENY